MRILLLSFLALSGLLLAQEDGREIMETVRKKQSLTDEERLVEMELIDRRGKSKTRTVRMWNRKADDLEKVMLVFLEPRDVEGTGLLTWEHADRADDQWLYLPSQKREKRISSGGKRNKFMGTDFTYEDLQTENLKRNNYNLVGEETLNGRAVWKIEAVPGDEEDLKSSGYSKRVLYVYKDIYYTAKIEYYDPRGTLFKTLENGEPKQVEGTVYRSDEFLMTDLRSEHKTKMVVKERKYNQGLDEDFFSLRELKSF